MSGSVSSFEATVICTAPTTSSSGPSSVNLCVSTGSAGAGAGGGGASTTATGLGTGCERINAHPASCISAASVPSAAKPADVAAGALAAARVWLLGVTQLILEEYRLIGQFIAARTAGRKMLAQQPRYARHGGHRTLGVAPGAVVQLDLAAHRLPRGLADARADA